jgi:hypothetical protein
MTRMRAKPGIPSALASRQHAGLGDQLGRAPLTAGEIANFYELESRPRRGSASILLALAGMLPATHLAGEAPSQ